MTGITVQVAGLIDAYSDDGDPIGNAPLVQDGQTLTIKALGAPAFLRVWAALGEQIAERMAAVQAPAPGGKAEE